MSTPVDPEPSASPEPTRSTRPVALVTGASSGIGEAFARLLAARGHDLVLVARREDRLAALAAELRAAHGTASEVLPADLADRGAARVVEERAAAGVDLLVANAGVGSTGRLVALDRDDEARIVDVNVTSLLRLVHAALSTMQARGSGGVITVSSVGGFQPAPGNATYSASKAFVTSFSQAVHEEARRDGVTVTCVCPGFTRTEMAIGAAVPQRLFLAPERVAAEALAALAAGRALCVPGVAYKTLAGVARLLPRGVIRRLGGSVVDRIV